LARDYQHSERQSGTEIRARQLNRLQNLYLHARSHIPLYREKYAGLGLEAIRSFEDFSELPILDRREVAQNARDMVSEKCSLDAVHLSRTGGSSGEPLSFYETDFSAPLGLAMMIRARRWWDIDFSDRNAIFIEHGLKFEEDWRSRLAMSLHDLREKVLNRVFFSAYKMAPEDLQVYYERLKRFKPVYLIGYASFLYLFARHLEQHDLPVEALGVRCVFYTSEMLYPWQKEVLQRVFECPIVGEYGLKEVGVVAYDCPAGSIHTMDDSLYVEVVPLDSNPAIGEVVVTQLLMPEAPFIRYRTGDLAECVDREAPCACGRGLQVMGPVQGRSHDWIVTPSGKTIHGQIFTHALIVRGSVDKFRVHQRSDYSFHIDAATTELYTRESEVLILDTLREIMGESLPVKIVEVSDIPAGSSGKHRWIKSDIGAFDRADIPSAEGSRPVDP
jgi:phenylacetate-CoA ligase